MALTLALSSHVAAQTVNYALSNETGKGSVSTLTVTELNNQTEATIQLWIKPMEWTQGQLISQDNFSLEMGESNTLIFKTGNASATFTAENLIGNWSQITVTVKNGSVKAYINNKEVSVTGSVSETFAPTAFNKKSFGCTIGKNFKGDLDEIRIWSRALDSKDFYWNNTLNKFNPNYDALVAYWKCDQNLCPNLVDYKGKHHGEMHLVDRVASNNNAMKYRVVTGYNSLMRFIDRPYVDRDMFLMTNDVVHLTAKIMDDGSILPEYPDNSLTGTKAGYLKEFNGRTGLMNFEGQGAVMEAKDGRILFDPRKTYGPSTTLSLSTWLYLDEWNEGAEIFSQYKDASNCLIIKLGNKDEQELIVNVCGTIATIKGALKAGQWQYLGVYINPKAGNASDATWQPIRIGIGNLEGENFTSKIYDRQSTDHQIVMSGNAMTTDTYPALKGARLTLGKDLAGKMDNFMVWGSDRSASMQNDATKPYQWNVGSWNNVFLNAYWTGDDAENPGKDYQSYTYMTEFMRGYFKGYRGQKLRVGIVSGVSDEWKNVLKDENKLSQMIQDMKEVVKTYDGIDLDLEWMYNSTDWNLYNHIVERLAKEVMVDHPEKNLTCSLHKVSYNGFNKALFPYVDYFTFQLYGPNESGGNYNYYLDAYNQFIAYGYPKDKILLSYGNLITNGTVEGYKDLFDKYGMNDDNFDPNVNQWNCNGTTKNFNGVNMTKKKQELILEKDVRGTMYFDMANDLRVSDPKSLIRAQNDIIAANVDTLITHVDMECEEVAESNYSYIEGRITDASLLNNGDYISLHSLYAPNGVRKQQGFIYYDKSSASYKFLNSELYLEPFTHILGTIDNEAIFQIEKDANDENCVYFKAVCQGENLYLKNTATGDLTTTANKEEGKFELAWDQNSNSWNIQGESGNYLGCTVEKPQIETTARPYTIYRLSKQRIESQSAPWFYIALMNCTDNTRNGRYMQIGQDENDQKIWNAPISATTNDKQIWRFEIGDNGLYAMVNYSAPEGSIGEVQNGSTGQARFEYDNNAKHYQFLLNENGSLSTGAWNNNFKTFTIKRIGSYDWYLNASNNGDDYYLNEWTNPNENKSGQWTSIPAVKLNQTGEYALASFCSPSTTKIPEGVQAYIVTEINDTQLILEQVYEGGILPANTPVILRSEQSGFYPMIPTADAEPEKATGNLLQGTGRERTILPQNSCYVLGSVDGVAGMYLYSANTVAPFKAYLPKTNGTAPQFRTIIFQDGETTGLEQVESDANKANSPIFNLQGQQVIKPLQKGIYIQNGKKFIVK